MTVIELTDEEAIHLRQLLETAARKGGASAWWARITRPLTRLLAVLP